MENTPIDIKENLSEFLTKFRKKSDPKSPYRHERMGKKNLKPLSLYCPHHLLKVVVAEVDGRGSWGQGEDWSNVLQGGLGKLDIQDQLQAIR